MAHDKYKQIVLTERFDRMGMRGEVKVFASNSGRYIAEYKLGTVKWQVPVRGETAIEAMEAAKKWLATPLGAR